jgi:hypothetical protein
MLMSSFVSSLGLYYLCFVAMPHAIELAHSGVAIYASLASSYIANNKINISQEEEAGWH